MVESNFTELVAKVEQLKEVEQGKLKGGFSDISVSTFELFSEDKMKIKNKTRCTVVNFC